jgi:archaellum component FlaC
MFLLATLSYVLAFQIGYSINHQSLENKIHAKLDKINVNNDKIHHKLDKINVNNDKIHHKLDKINVKCDNVVEKIEDYNDRCNNLDKKLDMVLRRIKPIDPWNKPIGTI